MFLLSSFHYMVFSQNFQSVCSTAVIINLNLWRNKKIRKSIDVPRPLSKDLWVFLFQKIDAECIKWVCQAGADMFVKCFTVNVNKCLKPIFIEQNINIVNIVTLQSLLLICRLIFTLCMQWRIQRGIMGFPRTFSPHHVYKYPIKMK